MTAYTGTSENDTQDGTSSSDSFDYSQGGDDTLNGKGGDDSFNMGSELTSADAIDGGDGNDTVFLSGFVSATFTATTMVNVETLVVTSGFASITTHDATVAAGQIMTIDAAGSPGFFFDGSAETDGSFLIDGGEGGDNIHAGQGNDIVSGNAGNDVIVSGLAGTQSLYGGADNDSIYVNGSGIDFVYGGTGADFLSFLGTIAIDGQLDGGSGLDTLLFNDGTSFVNAAHFSPSGSHFEKVELTGNVVIQGNGADNVIDFSGTPVDGGEGFSSFTIKGGGGNDTLTGSNLGESIYGGTGTNVLTGLGGADWLYAGSDHDTAYGGNGGDHLYGDTGQAGLYGGKGNDWIYADFGGLYTVDAGTGNDVVQFTGLVNAPNQILGGDGTDTLRLFGDVSVQTANFTPAALGFEKLLILDSVTVTGDGNGNTIDFSGIPVSVVSSGRGGLSLLSTPAITINGGGGNDTLTGSNLDDAIYGGAGTNVSSGLAGNDALFAGSDDDTMYGGIGNDQLTGSTGHAAMYGGVGNDTINADNGGDYLVDAGSGNDAVVFAGTVSAPNQILGGIGTDTLELSGDVSVETASFAPAALGFEKVVLLDAITVEGNENNNTIDFSGIAVSALPPSEGFDGGSLTIEGQGGDDTLIGSNLDDTIYGGIGSNSLQGLGGNDTLDVSESSGSNTLDGGNGGDLLIGGFGFDTMGGGSGNDHLVGGSGNETMNGGDGNDLIEANHGGVYTVNAGTGNDEVDFQGTVNSPSQLAGGTGTDDLALTGTVTVNTTQFSPQGSGFETVHIGSGVTVVAGTATTIDFSGVAVSGNVGSVLAFNGSISSDTITGSNWADNIAAGGGNDIVDGGASGNDTLDGGTGFNRLSFAHSAAAVSVSLATGAAQDVGGGRMLTISNFRFLDGSKFGDHLTGNDDGNLIDGGAGADFITGGLGADSLTGGDDADTFVYLSVSDSQPGALGRDIVDFRHAEHDTIDLSAIDADTGTANDQAFHLVAGTFTHNAGELIQLLDNGQTVIAGDVNGDAVADFEIQLTTNQTLVNGDFTF